jgi:formiminoglutamase
MDALPSWLAIERNDRAVAVSIPHAARRFPTRSRTHWSLRGSSRKDADWHVDQLYDLRGALGATIVRTPMVANGHRRESQSRRGLAYPGMATHGAVPDADVRSAAAVPRRLAPSEAQIAERASGSMRRITRRWAAELARLRKRHSKVVLYDAHSIRSVVPALFAGKLPVFNIGTNDGRSCDARLERTIADLCAGSGRSHVVNGRFKGGYITRHYGRPTDGVHAVQMELGVPELSAGAAVAAGHAGNVARGVRSGIRARHARCCAACSELSRVRKPQALELRHECRWNQGVRSARHAGP